ncbi:TetR/AcrR family transcriptional regulator [Saccharothrix coeruleofusca]|uniref:TetR family transcriptional regulator n=1 Tax=Saccharothrix coeruleofusca TaxID=33919 RepID=A0A918AP42_9PSEU|nr:helix-turn-helix domain-containing protein [Saccharothrix coeruleofusca]MBP2337550.1 AcrR family transcriptional regulator [Saccharothrix coeruleofusca]GGP65036.1 TetR family transcriptional regulator [Saccharothrix coeruleofusca]
MTPHFPEVPVAPGRPKRADAQRNYDRILAAARTTVAEHGADASLEEIARRAEVGSATLHRHFASRWDLLEALFHDEVERLCARVDEFADLADPADALTGWLRAVGTFIASTKGLAAALTRGGTEEFPQSSLCTRMIHEAGEPLLARAKAAGAVDREVSMTELIALVTAIGQGTENSAASAERLLHLALNGVRPR